MRYSMAYQERIKTMDGTDLQLRAERVDPDNDTMLTGSFEAWWLVHPLPGKTHYLIASTPAARVPPAAWVSDSRWSI